MDVEFNVSNQIIKQISEKELVNLSDNYLQLVFNFKTDDWTGLTKYVLIHHQGKVTRFGLINDKLKIPQKYLSSRKLIFTMYGVLLDDDEVVERITTNMIRLPLIYSGFTSDYDEDLDPVRDADIIENIWEGIDSKVSVSDVQDNLVSTDVDKPLSAKQGKVLKDLVDGKSDVGHVHDDRYYTESEMNQIISDLRHELNNKLLLSGDKSIIQVDDVVDLKAYVVEDGMPSEDRIVYFYKIVEE